MNTSRSDADFRLSVMPDLPLVSPPADGFVSLADLSFGPRDESERDPMACGADPLPAIGPADQPSVTDARGLVYIETYGCQMNASDSEIVAAILAGEGYRTTTQMAQADVVLVNTCAIREGAEQRIWGRLGLYKTLKAAKPGLVVGVLGCMAERLRAKLLERSKVVDLVVGPDAYRDLPRLLVLASTGERGFNTLLSLEETYADVAPVRAEGLSAWVTIMRGCDNMCAFCIVPFTRGRERSRPVETILREVEDLVAGGHREVTLLGQNVNSYLDGEVTFAQLLRRVAAVDPTLRVRFTSPHPKDFSDEVIEAIATTANLCNYIHLPMQSGSTSLLKSMNRTYTRDEFVRLVDKMYAAIPGLSLSTDIIAGFCGETEADHEETLAVMRHARFDAAYMFKYSERPGTLAARKLKDDVPEEIKSRRISEIVALQQQMSLENNEREIGRVHEVLIERPGSKGRTEQWRGRTDTNKMVVLPNSGEERIGDLVQVVVERVTAATLFSVRVLEPVAA